MPNKKPDDYQIEGANFISARRWALIADDMGLGKTGQLITACDNVLAEKILVVCPAAARINWFREFGDWSIFGNKGFSVVEDNSTSPTDKMICSFNYVLENYLVLRRTRWDVIIIDESHTIKEPDAGITKAVYGLNGLVRNTERMWLASGTPAPNHYGELWCMLYTFGLTKMNYWQFTSRYCHVVRQNNGYGFTSKVMGSKIDTADELREMLDQIMIRRTKDILKNDNQELPPITSETIFVPATPVDLARYQVTFADSLDDPERYMKRLLDQQYSVEKALALGEVDDNAEFYLDKIYDSVATLRRHNALAKLPELIKLLTRELMANEYEKIVIFAIHKDVIDTLREALKHFGSVTLYGGTSAKKRQSHIDSFMRRSNCRVFIGNIQAAGTAITLTSSYNVLFAEWPFTPGPISQAICRVYRRTQTMPVRCRFVAIKDSIDEKITYIYQRKAAHLAALFDENKAKKK